MHHIFPRRLRGQIHSTIPVCPACHRVMRRLDWDTARPHAACHPCGKSYYYSSEGTIRLTAQLRSVPLAERSNLPAIVRAARER